MDKLHFEALSPETLDACAAIAAYAPDPWSEGDLNIAMEDLNQWNFVALLGDKPVAFACFLTVMESADLRQIVVAPKQRNKGIGQKLLAHCLLELQMQGVERVLLELRVSNIEAMVLYKKTGFRLLARRPNMYSNPTEDGYLMAYSVPKKATT